MKGIPPFDELGLMPPGVYDCALAEVGERLCWNDHRAMLWRGFLAFIDREYSSLGAPVPVWIDGSFVRSKPLPSDIDIVLDFTDHDTGDLLKKLVSLRIRHDEIKATYHVDLWPRHPIIPADLAAYFQYVGDKCATELCIDVKHPKGILRVRP